MIQSAPSLDRIERLAFRRQEIAFCVLTLLVLASLLVLHTWFASLLGEPSQTVVLLLVFSSLGKLLEWYWLWHQRDGIGIRTVRIETAFSMVGLFLLTWLLAVHTGRDETPYFVLLAISILQCAYHCSLLETIVTVAAAIGLMFGWANHFYALHPPPRATQFLESGMISVIYAVMGLLVWYLVHQLGDKETRLFENMAELEATRERLAREEKLAAVGSLASGIAHEIRNPVAMIASSLETAGYPNANPDEREEMFAIAAREAKRLENLTSDFLAYARPRVPQRTEVRISDVLDHVANVTRLRASESGIRVEYVPSDDGIVAVDPFQLEGALVNLAINAIAATWREGTVRIRSHMTDGYFHFEVENTGEKIPENELQRIFEPFFTTKRSGTGLGLAIARAVARSHGGDILVSKNEHGAVAFTMTVATAPAVKDEEI